jgi:hypothetical protein
MVSIRKPIRVAVIFSPGGKVTPKWFELERRKHEVKETTYFWRDRVGEVPICTMPYRTAKPSTNWSTIPATRPGH